MNPLLIKVRQEFSRERLPDAAAAARQELAAYPGRIEPGARIAIAVGSRGIADIAAITREVVDFVKKSQAHPFIIPAMGSHGGATAAGQAEVLASLGVTEERMGAPVVSSMDVVELPRRESPARIFMDGHAWGSDGVILVHRVKPHTDFRAPIESGMIKICVVGLGKHKGALEIHRFGIRGLRDYLPAAGKDILATGKILFGLAIVENGYDETLSIEAVPAASFLSREPELLVLARRHMPHLPIDDVDVLIVDEMGKDISGTGLDPNIIGRLRISGQPEPATPAVKVLLVDDLTAGSHGNAIGVGLADVITKKLQGKIDFGAMYENARTSTFLERAKMPLTAADAGTGFAAALRSCGPLAAGTERIVRIKNTLKLAEVHVSAAVYAEIKTNVTALSDFAPAFAADGELAPF